MASVSEFRTGMTIRLDGQVFVVIEFQHVHKQNRRAIFLTKIKNVQTGRVFERSFRESDKLDIVRTDSKRMQYLYSDGEMIHCMDNESFEQVAIAEDMLGEGKKFCAAGGVGKKIRDLIPNIKDHDFLRTGKGKGCAAKK